VNKSMTVAVHLVVIFLTAGGTKLSLRRSPVKYWRSQAPTLMAGSPGSGIGIADFA
jgi:hypothetical protein